MLRGMREDTWARRAFQSYAAHYYIEWDVTKDSVWQINDNGSIKYDANISFQVRQAINIWKKSSFSETMPVYQFLQHVLGE